MFVVNLLNRAVVVLLLIVLFVAGLAVAIAPGYVAEQLRAWATLLDAGERLQLLGVGLLAAMAALGLLFVELRVRRPRAVALAAGDGVSVATETVVQRLRQEVEAVHEVVRVRPVVTARRGAVDVDLGVDTVAGADVPGKAAEVRQVAAAAIDRLGLKLGRLSVSLSQTGAAPLAPPTETPPGSLL